MPLPFILGGLAVAAAATGVKKGYDGYQDKSRADDIVKAAKYRYNIALADLNEANEKTEKRLEELGELQLTIGKDFYEFKTVAENLLDQINHTRKNQEDLKVSLPQYKINQINALAINSVSYLGKVVGGAVGGGAAAFAAYCGTMALGAASTGTAISSLSGVAAYNATMAALGGGSLAAGGFGMAGGAVVLGGVVAAPIIAVAGWAFASHAEDALSKAYDIRKDVNDFVEKAEISQAHLEKTRQYLNSIIINIRKIHRIFRQYFDELKMAEQSIQSGQTDVFDQDDLIQKIENGYALAAILTDIITTPVFKVKKENGETILNDEGRPEFETDDNGMQVLNDNEMKQVINQAQADVKPYSA